MYSQFLQSLEHVIQDLLGSGLATHVRREELGLVEIGINGRVDLGSSVLLAQELEHQSNGAQGSDGVGNALALDVGSATVARLTNGKAIADVGTRHQTQTTDQSGSTVRQDVTVQVRRNDNVVVLGLAEELVHHRVDDLLLNMDGGELLSGESLARSLAEQTVRLGQHVRLVGDGDHGLGAGGSGRGSGADLLAAQGDLARDGGNAGRGALGDALDGFRHLALGCLLGLLLLHVQVLGVLADNDQVNWVAVAAADGGLDGAHVGVQVELLAEGDDGR